MGGNNKPIRRASQQHLLSLNRAAVLKERRGVDATSASLIYYGPKFSVNILSRRDQRLKGRGKYIRASEVAEYVYCARAWRLRVEGHEPASGHGRRAEGEAWHLAHGRSLARARNMRIVAAVAFALALVAGLLLLLLRWR